MRQTNAITIFRKRASRVVLKCSSSEKNSRQLSDYIFWHRSHLWSSSGDIIKQPLIRRELFTLAALSITSLKWASSAMYWVIVLSYELFVNSRVGNISFTSSSALESTRNSYFNGLFQHLALTEHALDMYRMLRKNLFTRYDLPIRRLPYTATNSDFFDWNIRSRSSFSAFLPIIVSFAIQQYLFANR